jgi:hypothetical protein
MSARGRTGASWRTITQGTLIATPDSKTACYRGRNNECANFKRTVFIPLSLLTSSLLAGVSTDRKSIERAPWRGPFHALTLMRRNESLT